MDSDIELEEAIDAGDVSAVERVLAEGADPNGVDEDGFPYLTSAILLEDNSKALQIVKLLLKAGADPQPADVEMEPIVYAILVRDGSIIEALVAAGANLNAETDEDESLYDWAKFDYLLDVFDDVLPEEPEDDEDLDEDAWLQFLVRLAAKYCMESPQHLVVMRRLGALTSEEKEKRDAE